MFEVGKKYKKKGNGTVFQCLSIHRFRKDDVAGVLQYCGHKIDDPEDHGDIPYIHKWTDEWYEVHESVVVKSKKVVCFRPDHLVSDRRIYIIRKESMTQFDNVAGEVEVTVTDGKLTDVKIL